MARSALIVATDEYADPKLRELRTPADDAAALARVLGEDEIGAFDVELCMNAKAHELRRRLSRFFADRRPDDVLLLHFGCHGVKDDDGHLYFAAFDTEIDHLDATAIPAEFVNRRMNDSRSKRIMLFLDCCYSGAFASGMTTRAGEKVDVKERFEGSGRVVLTASSAMEYSFEGEDRHGEGRRSVFTSALVRGLETGEADRDQDHWISVDELYDYVFERVREATPNQTPGKWSFVQGDVLVARSSYVAPVHAEALPADVRTMLDSALPSMRAAIVPELERMIVARPQYRDSARDAIEQLLEDDSRAVAAAAQAALARLDAGADAPAPPPAVKIPAPAPVHDDIVLRSPAPIVVAATVLGLVSGFAAYGIYFGLGESITVAWLASGGTVAPALALVVVHSGRSTWRRARAVAAALSLGIVLSIPSAVVDAAMDEDPVVEWLLFGLAVGVAALVPSASPAPIRNAALLGGAASLLCGAAALVADPGTHMALLFVAFVVPGGVICAAIAVAIVLAPRVRRPGA